MQIVERPARLGLIGFIFGTLAFICAAYLVSIQFAPSDQSIGSAIGQIAGDIKTAARAAISGEAEPAAPVAPNWDLTAILAFIIPALSTLAILLGGFSLFRKEPRQLPMWSIGLGISAVLFQFAFWLAMVICGTLLLMSVLNNIGDIFA